MLKYLLVHAAAGVKVCNNHREVKNQLGKVMSIATKQLRKEKYSTKLSNKAAKSCNSRGRFYQI